MGERVSFSETQVLGSIWCPEGALSSSPGFEEPWVSGWTEPQTNPNGVVSSPIFFSPVLATTLSGLSEVTGYHPGLFQPWAKVRNPLGVEIPPEPFQI